MSIDEYLADLDARLRDLTAIIVSVTMQRELDTNLGLGFIKGRITFLDGSTLEFSKQLPVTRRKYRMQYMDAQQDMLARWDSAPHYPRMQTFPFHKHTPQGVEEHEAVTLLAVLEQVAKDVRI